MWERGPGTHRLRTFPFVPRIFLYMCSLYVPGPSPCVGRGLGTRLYGRVSYQAGVVVEDNSFMYTFVLGIWLTSKLTEVGSTHPGHDTDSTVVSGNSILVHM